MSPREKTLLTMDHITISTQRLSVGMRTFPISQIANVHIGKRRPSLGGAAFILFGMLFACSGLGASSNDSLTALVFMLITLGSIGLGVNTLIKAKPTYVVVVGTPAGPAKIYASKDKERVDAISEALHSAMFEQAD